jgi:tryptophan synthase alpha chain
MNRIQQLFREKQSNILSIYMTAGYPEKEDTTSIIGALQDHGADLVEIGIPFSDPLADGPVIQQSSREALTGGMSLKLLFEQLKGIRNKITIPLILMGYLNPVLKMGMVSFLSRCRETGIDGVIIPDLPPGEFESLYRDKFREFEILHPMLITPRTTPERVRYIAGLSGGFLYMVSDSSTTGTKVSISDNQKEYFSRIGKMDLPVPSLIGFGISNHETFTAACTYASGAIIGSAFIRMLGEEGFCEENIRRFIGQLRNG